MGSGEPIRLADAAPFRLGRLRFEPATRQMHDGAAAVTLEPRVMQVLVLLAEAAGRVVGRDELIQRCWDGRAVGEQAINRVVAILRKLASERGEAFAIETITRVGYRLSTSAGREDGGAAPAPGPAVSRRALAGAGLALGGAAMVGGALWLAPRGDRLSPEARSFIDRGVDELDQNVPGVDQQAPAYLRRATELAPESARAWGLLAVGYASSCDWENRAAAAATQGWARAAAGRALALDPANADARVALALMRPDFRRWRAYEAGLRTVLARAPDNLFALRALGRTLGNVGRWRDAIGVQRRWGMLAPDRLGPRMALAASQWQSGRLFEAERSFDEIARLWPSHRLILSARLNFLVLTGRAEQAERAYASVADQSRSVPLLPPELAIAASRAIAANNGAAKARAATEIREVRRARRMSAIPALAYLSALGAVTDAFEVLRGYLFGGALPWDHPFRPVWPMQRDTDLLFGASMRAMRADARFGQVTAALGLEGYWREVGVEPDCLTNAKRQR